MLFTCCVKLPSYGASQHVYLRDAVSNGLFRQQGINFSCLVSMCSVRLHQTSQAMI